jgi:TonB-dependent starch-binding outer membrane protein SusC
MISKLTYQSNQRSFLRSMLLLIFLIAIQVTVFAQGKQITGTVTDNTGVSLPGVNVLIKGATIGTITDIDGKYAIKVSKESDVLVFSFIGYLEQSISVANKNQINVVLKEDVLQLNEVVSIGYGIQKKSDITGSVTSVKADNLKNMSSTRTDEALQGKAAGVMVLQNSGQPGSSPVIRVRGLATVNGGNPLIIIDGVSGGSLGDINPSDIESIEVLKDAASQGIYGSAGGNGVILVTTKHGNSGKIKVNLNAFAGIQQPWAINVKVADAQQYAAISNQYQSIMGKTAIFQSDGTNYLNPIDNSVLKTTDWTKEIFRKGVVQNYNISMNGGGKISNFFFSVGYSGDQGTVLKTFNNKINVRLNSDHKITKWLKIGENLSLTNNVSASQGERNEYGSPLATSIQMLPFVPIFATDGSGNYNNAEAGIASNVKNPLAQIEFNNNLSKNNSLFGNVYLRADIIKGLSFESRYGMNYNDGSYIAFTPIHSIGAVGKENPSQGSSINSYNRNVNNSSGWQWQNFLTYNLEIEKNNFSIVVGTESGKYKNSFTNKTKSGGFELETAAWKEYTDTTGFNTDQKKEIETAGYAYFGRINYDYAGIVLLQANFRRDYSSVFGPNNRIGNFPSVSAGLKFSEFEFIKNLNVINFGKIRIGYGETGNSNIQPFLYLNSFGALNVLGYPYDGKNIQPGAALLTAENADLKWETVITKNIGLDLGLLKNKLNLSIDFFQRSNKDMLLRKSVPLTVGYMVTNPGVELGDPNLDTRPLVNYGTLDNRGFEVSAGYKDQVGDFKFEINANLTHAVTVIDDIGDPLLAGQGRGLSNVCRTQNGEPVSAFYGYKIEGIYQESDLTWYRNKVNKKWFSIPADPTGTVVISNTVDKDLNPIVITAKSNSIKAGYYKYFDASGNGSISAEDMVNIGDPNPKFTYGFGGSMEYKGFDLNFFFQGSYGNKIFNMLKVNSFSATNGGLNWSPDLLNSYIPAVWNTSNPTSEPTISVEAKNTDTGIARIDADLSSSEFYVEDGSYLRLKNIQIGYNLPKSFISKLKIENFRIYVGAKNLLTFTKYTGFDPEVGETSILERGFDRGTYPQSKTFLFGINASF